jgi:hypothetical protein
MLTLSRRRRAVLFTCGLAAAGALTFGIASASIPGPDNQLHACYKVGGRKPGAMRAIDSAGSCATGELPLQWALHPLNAVIDANGALLHSSGVTAISHPATGVYDVTFSADLGQCAETASGAGYVPAVVNAFAGVIGPGVVEVRSWSLTGQPLDHIVQLLVSC